jgi:hypothetical protein
MISSIENGTLGKLMFGKSAHFFTDILFEVGMPQFLSKTII